MHWKCPVCLQKWDLSKLRWSLRSGPAPGGFGWLAAAPRAGADRAAGAASHRLGPEHRFLSSTSRQRCACRARVRGLGGVQAPAQARISLPPRGLEHWCRFWPQMCELDRSSYSLRRLVLGLQSSVAV